MVDVMEQFFGSCTNFGECEAACPKEISIDFIALLNKDYCRSAAEATLQALENLILSGYAVARIDWLDLVEPRAAGQPAIMHAAVLFRTADQEDLLIGSALVRGVEYEAAVRATLDACNRQVEMLLRATRDD
jgi:hypothetical protein